MEGGGPEHSDRTTEGAGTLAMRWVPGRPRGWRGWAPAAGAVCGWAATLSEANKQDGCTTGTRDVAMGSPLSRSANA